MKGTEKQIKWANEISETVITIFREAIVEIEREETNETIKEQNISAINERIAAIENADYAGDIINLFKSIRKTGDNSSDFGKLLAVYYVSAPCTAGEKKILCK